MRVQKLLGLMVVRGVRDESMPCQYAPRVSIRHEEGTLRGIEDDGVNRLRPKTAKVQQPASEFIRRQKE
jgi:hypothetical protein